MKYPELTMGKAEAIINKHGGMKEVERFLRDEVVIKPRKYIVRVDRSQETVLSENLPSELLHPELQHTGQRSYDLAQIEKWTHPKQNRWITPFVSGAQVHQYLIDNDILESFLGYADGLAIKKKGVETFRRLFGNNRLLLWRSAAQMSNGDNSWLVVPQLLIEGQFPNEVTFRWAQAHGWLKPNYLALRFPSRRVTH